jgi:hypothetical protein
MTCEEQQELLSGYLTMIESNTQRLYKTGQATPERMALHHDTISLFNRCREILNRDCQTSEYS